MDDIVLLVYFMVFRRYNKALNIYNEILDEINMPYDIKRDMMNYVYSGDLAALYILYGARRIKILDGAKSLKSYIQNIIGQ